MILYIKTGTRYHQATLAQVAVGTVEMLQSCGLDALANDFVEQLISRLTESRISDKDARLITHNVVQQIKAGSDASSQ